MIAFDDFEIGRHRTAKGVDLVYRDSGGTGVPVVLLHGWPQHSLMWHSIAPRIAATGRRVIAPDLRGSRASAIMPSGYDKVTMAADVHDLIVALVGDAPIDLAGYDLGSGVAAAYAMNNRSGVRRLAVMEFGLAGFGFEQMMAPTREWNNASNWHLALMSVPDAAEWLFRGREREMLACFSGICPMLASKSRRNISRHTTR